MKSPEYRVLLGSAFAVAVLAGGQARAGSDTGETGQLEDIGDLEDVQGGDTGINITGASVAGWTDVAQIKLAISRVACVKGEKVEEYRTSAIEPLASMQLPGGIPAFENNPLDAGSQHSFSDHFESLMPGCYDVVATPLQQDGSVSDDCDVSSQYGIVVEEGQTTDVMLISQCSGTSIGALDTTVALNQPPALWDLTFTPSKFMSACQKTIVCATAADPNNDPMEFEWVETSGRPLAMSVVSVQRESGTTTECVQIQPSGPGNFSIEVRVFDLVHDPNIGLIRVERWLREHGNPGFSRASLAFPVFVGF
jgi:hypothetical protein